MYLRVSKSKLTDIETRYQQSQGLERCKEELLGAWFERTPGASWKELINALRLMDRIALATELEAKYCQLSSSQNGD